MSYIECANTHPLLLTPLVTKGDLWLPFLGAWCWAVLLRRQESLVFNVKVDLQLAGTQWAGASREGQQISTHGKQDQHAVKMQAASRGLGPGQCQLEQRREETISCFISSSCRWAWAQSTCLRPGQSVQNLCLQMTENLLNLTLNWEILMTVVWKCLTIYLSIWKRTRFNVNK